MIWYETKLAAKKPKGIRISWSHIENVDTMSPFDIVQLLETLLEEQDAEIKRNTQDI